jgi:hypothetical protein
MYPLHFVNSEGAELFVALAATPTGEMLAGHPTKYESA